MNDFSISLNKAYKNYHKLKSYIELTKGMINDYKRMKKEYNNISKEYIQKITQLNSNYSKTISNYKSTLEFSDGQLDNLIKLFEKLNSIILFQGTKLHSFIERCDNEEKNNKIKLEKLNNYEKISNEFLLKEKKITKSFSDLENYYKNLFNSYQIVENSLTINILSKENKKISLNEIINQEYKNSLEKEKIVIKAKKDIEESKNDFFKIYDELIKIEKEIAVDNINILTTNINSFINLYSNYCKNFYDDLEKIIKSISNNEMKTNFLEILNSTVSIFDRNININGYKIKIISNKYIEDKKKILNLEKMDRNGYLIKDNKILLKDEDIYEIAKTMYGQFQFLDDKYYNLTEEQIKLNVKDLTQKLLSFNKSAKKNDDNKYNEPMEESEINLLMNYLDKSFYRLELLKVLNLYRTKSYEISEKEFEILKKIFLIIADKIISEEDIRCAKLILILAQTFYCKIDNKDVYIQYYLKNHKLFSNMEIWEKYLNNIIEDEINRTIKIEKKDIIKSDEQNKKYKIDNILSSILIPFCDNMIEFGMDVEKLYKIIEPIMEIYHVEENLKGVINELIKSKEKKVK